MSNTKKLYTLITGASSGIGHTAAKSFAKRGKNLIIIARREEKLAKLKEEILHENSDLEVIIKVVDLEVSENAYKLYEDLKPYTIETWINNAGFGYFGLVENQDVHRIESMIALNITSLTILSYLYVKDYRDVENTQIINLSSAGGYSTVPTGIAYCATKFFVGAFTEALSAELQDTNAKMQAKVLAPAATKTEFAPKANDMPDFDYDTAFANYHTSEEMAEFLMELYDSNDTVGLVDRKDFKFHLSGPIFEHVRK